MLSGFLFLLHGTSHIHPIHKLTIVFFTLLHSGIDAYIIVETGFINKIIPVQIYKKEQWVENVPQAHRSIKLNPKEILEDWGMEEKLQSALSEFITDYQYRSHTDESQVN